MKIHPLAYNRETGRDYWRSLDELADNAEFRHWIEQEFPGGLDQLNTPSRRHFLKIMAASFALAGWSGCERAPEDELVPYVREPRGMTPGRPLTFATALTRSGYACGVHVTSYEGRPTKIEGNPRHPASLGATDVFAQAEILSFWDPDRSRAVVGPNGIASWSGFLRELQARLVQHGAHAGHGMRLLTGNITSPTRLALIESLLKRFPEMRWHVHDPLADHNESSAIRQVLGRPARLIHDLSSAERILSVDCNFLFDLPGSVRYARDFASKRKIDTEQAASQEMNRLYVAEVTPTTTGAKADHRLRTHPSLLAPFVEALAVELGVEEGNRNQADRLDAKTRTSVQATARDLATFPKRSVVLIGRGQPPRSHALGLAINEKLDAFGKTVRLIPPLCAAGNDAPESLNELAQDMAAGDVETLLMIDVNPAYSAPQNLAFPEHLKKVEFAVHMGLHANETAEHCRWHIPLAHELESWDDARAFDGTVTILQPLIAPLYRGRTANELLANLVGETLFDAKDLVRQRWRREVPEGDFEDWWHDALKDGVIPDSASLPLDARIDVGRGIAQPESLDSHPSDTTDGGLELVLLPGSRMWDGRYANNAWLQELPDPVTGVTWDNAALISPSTAGRFALKTGDVVAIRCAEVEVEAPVFVLPGQADDVLSLALGYGRSAGGPVAQGVGVNAYPLRTAETTWHRKGVSIQKTGRTQVLAQTQNHHVMEGRDLLRRGLLSEFRSDPWQLAHEGGRKPAPLVSLYPPHSYPGQQWGMSIDLTSCIGCGACTIACQAENNIAVVGREQVHLGREMHWIRVDRYFAGQPEDPAILHQPVPCMHCEDAPCELVCPVGATQHSHDGLNEMIYNRCIGTRYCSNNCPYKVRRFNFYRYTEYDSETRKLQRNPEVTVRARGVMEKCTYCVQRIRNAEIDARKENRQISDGGIVTACQQACPTQAIVFGDINDKATAVSQAKQQGHSYAMLRELNVRPRTTYLAEIRNPNPALASSGDARAERSGTAGNS
ncbi:MAG: TAT-variant-translocated molybdopterin oxidoreductase [Phycisphaerae bacterium]|nr:TAT-variant-translocated molybdopterin oxidoreductase [Phycisphaerae bacterium]